MLAGLALAGRRRLVVLAALVLMMLESANLPLRLERYDGPSEASRWLAGKPGAVLVLPLAENDTLAMLDGLAHLRPLVNGDSGFIPRPFDRAMELFEHGLDAESLRFLRAVGVRHVTTPELAGEPARPACGRWRASRASVCSSWKQGEPASRRPAGRAGGHALVVGGRRADAAGAAPDRPRRVRAVGRALGRAAERRGVARRRRLGAGRGHAPASPTPRCRSTGTRRHARGEIRFAPRPVRFLRLDARLPARGGAIEVGE